MSLELIEGINNIVSQIPLSAYLATGLLISTWASTKYIAAPIFNKVAKGDFDKYLSKK